MNEFARQFDRVVRYSVKPPPELTALINAVYENQDQYLPRAVLADYLEENPHYAHNPELDIPMLRQGHDGEPLLHILPYSLPDGKIQSRPADDAVATKGRLVADKLQAWVGSGLLSGRQLNEAVQHLNQTTSAYHRADTWTQMHYDGDYDRTHNNTMRDAANAVHSIDSMYKEPPATA